MSVQHDLPAWIKPPKTMVGGVLLPGAHIRVFQPRKDGFSRVEIEEFDVQTIRLYMTADERRELAQALLMSCGEGVAKG
jgi:hypothetical protein